MGPSEADQLRDWLAWARKRLAGIPEPSIVDRIEAEALRSRDADLRAKVNKLAWFSLTELSARTPDQMFISRAAVLALLAEK